MEVGDGPVPLGVKGNHLAHSVDTAVCAPRGKQGRRLLKDLCQCAFQGSLDCPRRTVPSGRQPGTLDLEPAKGRAIIFYRGTQSVLYSVTNSIRAIGAASPLRYPNLRMRV
jgi:hypothetical protein